MKTITHHSKINELHKEYTKIQKKIKSYEFGGDAYNYYQEKAYDILKEIRKYKNTGCVWNIK